MAKRQTKNKRKRSVLAPSPPQMVILRVCMVLLALLLAAITLLNRGSDTVMNTAYPRKYDEYVTYYAGKYQIDPYILYSIIRTESSFNPQAESNVGARGLMQITEITFDWIKTKIAPDEPLTFDDLYDPEVNIRFGSYFISYCLQRYDDDLATAAAAYHSGLGTVDTLLADSQYSQDGKVLDAFPYPHMRSTVKYTARRTAPADTPARICKKKGYHHENNTGTERTVV